MITQSGELNVTLQGGAIYTLVVTQALESTSNNVTVSYRKTGWTLVYGKFTTSFSDHSQIYLLTETGLGMRLGGLLGMYSLLGFLPASFIHMCA